MHSKCSQRSGILPTRLLFADERSSTVRLVHSDYLRAGLKYVTLSYCVSIISGVPFFGYSLTEMVLGAESRSSDASMV